MARRAKKDEVNVEPVKTAVKDFSCPVCSGAYHEQTELFDAEKPLHGAMFRLKQDYVEMAWDRFEEDESTLGDNLICPGCGNCYADSMTGIVRAHGG